LDRGAAEKEKEGGFKESFPPRISRAYISARKKKVKKRGNCMEEENRLS